MQRIARIGSFDVASILVLSIQKYFLEANLPLQIHTLEELLRTELTSMESHELVKMKESLKDQIGVDVPCMN
jgi:hypothetical protein